MREEDCDHPEEALGPLPNYSGRPARADEWECSQCGAWKIVDPPEYKRRKLDDSLGAYDFGLPHTSSPSRRYPPSGVPWLEPVVEKIKASIPVSQELIEDGDMFAGSTHGPMRAVRPDQAIMDLIHKKKLLDFRVDQQGMPAELSDKPFSWFARKFNPPMRVLTASGIMPHAILDVMAAMYEMVARESQSLRWKMAKPTFNYLRVAASMQSQRLLGVDDPDRMTAFGGDIVLTDEVLDDQIVLLAR